MYPNVPEVECVPAGHAPSAAIVHVSASLRDGASTTVDTATPTSKAARAREQGEAVAAAFRTATENPERY